MKKCRCWRDVELRLVVGGLIAWEKNRQSHSDKLGHIKSLILKLFAATLGRICNYSMIVETGAWAERGKVPEA